MPTKGFAYQWIKKNDWKKQNGFIGSASLSGHFKLGLPEFSNRNRAGGGTHVKPYRAKIIYQDYLFFHKGHISASDTNI